MVTKHWQETDRCGSYTDESTVVAEVGDVECSLCETIVEQDNARQCDVCGGTFCRDCVKVDYKGSGKDVCTGCIDNDLFINDLVNSNYTLENDKTELLKTLDKILSGR